VFAFAGPGEVSQGGCWVKPEHECGAFRSQVSYGPITDLERTGTGALQSLGVRDAETINGHATNEITLLVARSGKSGKGHEFLLKCDPSPLPPLQWLWLAGDGFAA